MPSNLLCFVLPFVIALGECLSFVGGIEMPPRPMRIIIITSDPSKLECPQCTPLNPKPETPNPKP